MIINEMSMRECGDLLARLGFGRLACAHENQPYIVPTYFTYEPGCLYGFATMGRKIEWMRLNPLVCVEADEVRSRAKWESVVARGRYEEVSDTAQYALVRKKAEASLEKHESWWQFGICRRSNPCATRAGRPDLLSCPHRRDHGTPRLPGSCTCFRRLSGRVTLGRAKAFGARMHRIEHQDSIRTLLTSHQILLILVLVKTSGRSQVTVHHLVPRLCRSADYGN